MKQSQKQYLRKQLEIMRSVIRILGESNARYSQEWFCNRDRVKNFSDGLRTFDMIAKNIQDVLDKDSE